MKPRRKKTKFELGTLAITGGLKDEISIWASANPDDVDDWQYLEPHTIVIVVENKATNNYTRVVTHTGLSGWVWTEDLRPLSTILF